MQGYALEKGAVKCHQAVSTSNLTTTSGSFIDMTGMTVTFTLRQKKDVMIFFTGVLYNNLHGWVYTNITVDGVNKCQQSYYGTTDGEGREQVTGIWKENLAAGQHTVKMQWKTTTGTASVYGASDAPTVLQVLEMGAEQENPVATTGQILQIVNYQTGDYSAGSTGIPHDNTIPQNTEGDELMTLAITPSSASNKLKIDVVVNAGTPNNNFIVVALFQDDTVNAIATADDHKNGNESAVIAFTHYMTAGTTSSTIFKVRAGVDSTGVLFNGSNGSARMGGTLASSITITEIAG